MSLIFSEETLRTRAIAALSKSKIKLPTTTSAFPIRAAFVYGSVAKGSDKASSDIDLIVISDTLAYPDVFEAVQAAEARLARPVNPTVMTAAQWRAKRTRSDSFVARLATQPRIFLIGSDDALG